MFEVGKANFAGATGADLAYIQAVINGEAPVLQMAIGVLLDIAVKAAVDGEPEPSGNAATDAQINTAVSDLFSIYANAWAARTL
jgi:hypothetical protein